MNDCTIVHSADMMWILLKVHRWSCTMHYWYCPLPAILNYKTKNACGYLDLDICGWSEAPAPSEIMARRGWDTSGPGPGRSKKTLTGRTQSATGGRTEDQSGTEPDQSNKI